MVDFLIIARSGRALAASAKRAKYKVIVADCFADVDTEFFSESVHQLRLNGDDFIKEELLTYVREVTSRYPNMKLVLGSGFESTPELIDNLDKLAPVLSNCKETIIALKNPSIFFSILKKNAILHPQHWFSKSNVSKKHLIKKNAGVGGTHVNWSDQIGSKTDSNYYFQEYVSGTVLSALFLANSTQANIIGFNQQIQSNGFTDMPFLYQGAISLKHDTVENKEVIESIINKITKETNLKGLCGLDYIVNETGDVVVLEINPRPPSTFELHEEQQSLFNFHIASFDGKLLECKKHEKNAQIYRGYAILYAKENSLISDKLKWPSWVKDVPQQRNIIPAKSPICTVHAKEISLDKVQIILSNRLLQIETMIAATQNAT